MNLFFEWPRQEQPIVLDKALCADNALALDVNRGVFEPHSPEAGKDVLVFYWHRTRLVVMNASRQHVCSLDGDDVPYGVMQSIRHESSIQAGNFLLRVKNKDTAAVDSQSFYRLLCGEVPFSSNGKLSEVGDILPHGGDLENDQRYLNEVILAQSENQDVLKKLEIEYKRFLIWQEQDEDELFRMQDQDTHIFRTDSRFDTVCEEVRDKTLTECIIGRPFLMEKLWPELNAMELQDESLYDEKRRDILWALAPENISSKVKDRVPELVSQDFRKVGLDSHY